jgi:hypothetical protein
MLRLAILLMCTSTYGKPAPLMQSRSDAALELATGADDVRYAKAPLDNNKPPPNELRVMAALVESATKAPYLEAETID